MEFLSGQIAPVTGINLCGYLRTESGVGSAARGYFRALQALGLPVALQDVSSLQINRSEDGTLAQFGTEHPYEVNLVCADIELHYAILSYVGEDFFKDRYNIAIWAWELPRFPQKWFDRFAYYDEVWVGTSFIATMLAPIAPIPVVRIPPVLTMPVAGSREQGRLRLGAAPAEVVYLFIFDFHSHFHRKNPLAVIQAFKQAFRPTDPVRLVIKCVNAEDQPEQYAWLQDVTQGYPISLYAGYWPAEEVRDLMAAADVYVSLHRSEGTGLTITDALALGKPVIATGWSGNMDFMNVANSFPVRYDLVQLRESVGPYRAGETWAEPSVEHAAEHMRSVFEHRAEAQARGERARQEIAMEYSPQAIAGLIRRRLEAIAIRRQFPAFQEAVREHIRRYQQLPDHLRGVVRVVVPPEIPVIVVSKGDDDLVKLDGRPGWHFPQRPDGVYAGYYPADSLAAIDHLEALRAKGGRYLLFPSTAFWWLDYYQEFRRHVETRYQCVWSDAHCMVYCLA